MSSMQPSTSTSNPTPPSPPLLRANERPAQIQQVPVQQAPLQQSTDEIGEMLFDVSSLPPMQGYNVELIRDSEGSTYMKM